MGTKKVILIRHGDYENQEPCNLSERGKKDILGLAFGLFSEIKDKKVAFISSMANRATQSAEVLQAAWEERGVVLPFQRHYEVWSGTDAHQESKRLQKDEGKTVSVYDQHWLTNFINAADKEVIIVVTHLEFVNYYPSVLRFFPGRDINKGEALLLDFETMKCSVV